MKAWRQSAAIFGCALVAGAASAVFHPRRPPWREVESPGLARWRLDAGRVRALVAEGPVLWIDARPRPEHESSHLPGAILLNPAEWAELMFEHQNALQEAFQRPVVVHGEGDGDRNADEIAQRLRELLGLDPVYVLQGDWRGFLPAP